MKRILLTIGLFCSTASAQQTAIPAFPLRPNDLQLSRLAQPLQYFDKMGKRAALMGLESGNFEAWVWPWKPLRNFELSFLLGTSTQPILARDIVRSISVTPEVTTLTYTYESFAVREHILVPRDEPGAIILLEVHTTQALTIVAGFLPVMQPMWPAGVGGQFSYWDDGANAYVISEGQWRAIFLCGSPAGRQMAAPPAHMFADIPLQFKIDVKPDSSDGLFFPIVIAGAVPSPETGKTKMDSVKATYARLWKNAERYYRENEEYYRKLRQTTLQVVTPDKQFNLAYEWGKVALDNLMTVNPQLGYGMVAGFGLSGGGARPGFSWFFGGDAFINSLAMNGYGDFQKVRDALAFTQKWQRQDNFPIRKKNPGDPPKDVGKMAHELSQSNGLCDWWNDYHYGYNHADTTPWYIVAMGDYVRTSGDSEFLRSSWKSVKQAYDWCLSKDTDGDGLMDLKGAGLGALEFGKLVGIYADVYTCGVWVQAIKEMKFMAEIVGDREAVLQAETQLKKAQPQLEKKFWLEKEGFYSYGATEKGEQVKEKTPWSGVAMMFGLLDGQKSSRSIEAFNGADLCTDWGVRSLSNKSQLFEATNYNYGAVWPFISSFFNTAQFKHHYSHSGYQVLHSNVQHAFDHALGVVPEVFSGEMNEKLGEGYHHQGFSTTGYMLPFIRGLLGLDVDAVNKKVTLSPHLPSEWKEVSIANLRVGPEVVSFRIVKADGRWEISAEKSGQSIIAIELAPMVTSGFLQKESIGTIATGLDSHVKFDIPAWSSGTLSRSFEARVQAEVFPRASEAHIGSTNRDLKIVAVRTVGREQRIIVEGRSGESYSLSLFNPAAAEITGATLEGSQLRVSFEGMHKQEFVRREIIIKLN